ncbi:acetylcholinesterase-like isoform X2 [Argiope bruennichi]|uniref:acetylcholinesterase n=1 Tax=Argiope bruennichi TaxID=94029 RepID=A0A8T0F3L8_ARGBR|nr:acetylcholinesterase-like isoform X2 [Argiope bruennichi]KAF8783539.1 Acetylcholinesterase like protein [Argiope bruennichi]
MEVSTRALLILLCSFYCGWACKNHPYFQDAGPLVKTNTGSVIGTYVKVFDTDVAAFLGIPYAKPPTGRKRFQKPEPIEPWEGKLFANKKPRPCMQYSSKNYSFIATTKPSEDCLYLNVWTPKERCCDAKELLPVLVWIHGGAFVFGSTDIELYDGSIIATYGNVVLVSMNYRLGAFGFLNFGTKDAPGNMGLHDQRLALKWIKENIHFFGGDAKKTTIFGESAGAMSASAHMISPLSRNLFNRVILQSGAAYHPNLIEPPTLSKMKSKMLAQMANCTNGSDEVDSFLLTACLRKLEAMTLAQIEDGITSKSVMFFAPSYDNEFLPVSPIEAYESGDIALVNVLMGVNRDEGSLFLNFMLPDIFPSDKTPKITKTHLRPILSGLFQLLPEQTVNKIMNFYFQSLSEEDTEGIIKALSDSFGDYIFNCPSMYLAEKLKNVYLYYLTHRSSKDTSAEWLGVPHFYDVQFVFGKPIVDLKLYTPEDARFSGDLIRKWVSFAENGYPIDENQWPKFSSTNLTTYELNPRSSQQIKYPHKEACEFWREFIQES